MSSRSRRSAFALHALISGAFALTGCGRPSAAAVQSGTYEGTPLEAQAADFQLVDQDGIAVSLSDFRGKVVALTFMDSQCQEVCPLTSVQLRTAYERLEPSEAGSVVFLAVNVNVEANGEHDVRAATEKWRLTEIPNFHFLTGSELELAPVWEAYNVAVQPAVDEGEELLHTPGVFLIDHRGQMRWYVSTPFDEDGTPQWTAPLSDLLVKHLRALIRER